MSDQLNAFWMSALTEFFKTCNVGFKEYERSASSQSSVGAIKA